MKRNTPLYVAVAVVAAIGLLAAGSAAAQSAPAAKSELAGLATVSGTVTSPSPFKAAKVYLRNTNKRVQYMVYTAGGKYQAMHLMPGKYEMRVEADGLDSPVTQLTLNPGSNPPQNAALRAVQDTGTLVVTMDQMFPSGHHPPGVSPGTRYRV